MGSPLEKPEGLNWNAASVELPDVPMIQPGGDAMSMTIAGVLPAMAASLTANVATLQAKETMFSGKLVAAEAAYGNADDQGGQAVGQLTSMLGQLGQLGQQAGQAGGMTGQFGQLMEPLMKAFESMKSDGAKDPAAAQQGAQQPQGAGAIGAGASQGGGAGQQQSGGTGAPQTTGADAAGSDEARREDERRDEAQREEREARESRERDERHQAAPPATAGPADGSPGPGPVPVAPDHPRQTGGDEDLARRM